MRWVKVAEEDFMGFGLDTVVLVSDAFSVASGNWDDVHKGGFEPTRNCVPGV